MDLFRKYKDAFFRDITSFGGLTFYVIVLGLFFLQDNLLRSYQLMIGLILIYVIAITIRMCYFKYRPSMQKYATFVQKLDASSFPSVHAARGTLIALVLLNVMQNWTAGIILGLLALGNAYSRVYLKEHDYVDVLGGMAVGLILGFFILKYVIII